MRQLVSKLKYYFKIYYFLSRFSILSVLIYRINALVIGLAPIVWLATMLIFLATIFSRVKQLGGWSFWEIVFLTGIHEIIFLLVWTIFAPNLRRFIKEVRTGEFDQVLLKPISPRFMASFRFLDFSSFGSFLNAIFVFFYSFNQVKHLIDFTRLAGFLLFLFIGFWTAYFVYFIFSSLALFFINSQTLFEWTFDLTDFDRYPAEIYHSWVRVLLTFFLPILFFAYFPTAFLLGKVGWSYLFLGVAILFVLYFLSHYIWHAGLRHYQSASS